VDSDPQFKKNADPDPKHAGMILAQEAVLDELYM
jgi:hypothetical protein